MHDSDSFAADLRELAAAPAVFRQDAAALGDLSFGSVIAERYEILGRIGAGGMGVVFLARDRRLQRNVALKVHPNRLEQTEVERLHREARAMAQIAHPNVATVFDVGNFRGWLWVVMELVDGGDARAWLAARARSWQEIRALFVQAGRGLAAAHGVGLVHRDFKPDNVLVSVDEAGRLVRARVADFGLAQSQRQPTEAEAKPGALWANTLTRDGAIAGTYVYMAPEQHEAADVDARADQFAFCVSLLEALTSTAHVRAIFSVQSKAAALSDAQRQNVVPSRLPRIARTVLARGMSSDPGDRYPTMEDLVAVLERRSTVGPIIGAAVGMGAIAGGLALGPSDVDALRCPADGSAASVWPAIRRTRLANALTSAQVMDANATLDRVDHYVQAWRDARSTLCATAAAEDPELFDRKIRCLADRLAGLDATLSALPEFSASQLRRAVRVLPNADSLAQCLDAAALDAPVPVPANAADAARVDELLGELRQWPAREAAGGFVDAEHLYAGVVVRARALGHPQLIARALFVHGSTLASLGHWAQARPVLEEAFSEARACGYDHIAHQAAASLVTVVGFGIGDRDAAWVWLRHAESLATRTVGSLDARMLLMSAKAQLYEADEDHEKALSVYRDLLELSAGVDDKGLRRGGMLTNVANLLASLGRHEEALETARESAEVFAAALGEDHPNLAISHAKIGDALEGLGRMEEAEREYRRMVEVFEAALGSDNPQSAVASAKLGEHLLERGLHAEAIPPLSHAAEVLAAADRREVGYVSTLLGNALLGAGRVDEALRAYRQALTFHVADPEKEPGARADLASALLELGEFEEANEELTRAQAQATEREDDETLGRVRDLLKRLPGRPQ